MEAPGCEKDLLEDELKRVDDVLAAPSRPFVRNYEEKVDVSESEKPKVHGFSLKH